MKAGTSRIRQVGSGVARFFVGPWPLFPFAVFIAEFIFVLLQNLQTSIFSDLGQCRFSCVDLPSQLAPGIAGMQGQSVLSPFDFVAVIGNALIFAGVIAGVLKIGTRLLPQDPLGSSSRTGYLGVLLVAALLGAIARIYVLSPIFGSAPSLSTAGILPTTIRTLFSIMLVQGLSGMLTLRYARQTATARAATEVIKQQQQLVIESDERARRHIAQFLHDRVQADLLVVGMELRALMEQSAPQQRDQLERAISQIERIRSSEVRSASRRLSPALGSVGLDTALQELADSWQPALEVDVSFDAQSRSVLMHAGVNRDLLTAIYRICEQAILNAASHGKATRVSISISESSPTMLRLLIDDDGQGLSSITPKSGAGTAIMDAWCAAVGGEWSREHRHAGGVRIQATFPIRP